MAAAAGGAACSAPLPIKAFFQPPASRGAQLSPSGRYLALIEMTDQGDAVAVLDLDTRKTTMALKAGDGRGVDWVRWKGDDRLLAGLAAHGGPDDDVGADDLDGGGGGAEVLTALDRDGGAPVTLQAGEQTVARARKSMRIADALSRDPAHVLVVAPDAKGAPSLWKVDVHSGSGEFVAEGEGDADGRLPRGAMIVRYDHKAPAEAQGFDVLGPADGGRKAFVALPPRGPADGDTTTIRVYDFGKKTLSDPVWPALKYDVSEIVYHEGDNALAGVCYTADAYTCVFKDAKLNEDYARAGKSLGGLRSLTPLSMSDNGRFWLFGVSGPDLPGAYYVFDRTAGTMTLAADRRPGLPAARLGAMQLYGYAARDGARIPGYLTRPPGAGKGPLPLLVMPHGGPEARDSYAFDIWTQYFATRGYLVFQPNFRGSSGYGRAYARAGYGQWGGRSQDDITDGVRQLIKDGLADPKRICIFGASFGGYAALFGGAQTPELYRCVASFAGVSDLNALVRWEKATKGHEGRYRYALTAIGDPAHESARLAAASPITHVAAYRPPVLLIHGSKDASVPLAQSEAMAQALRAAGKDVRLVVYPGEGHADWTEHDEEAALTEIDGFLQAHLAPGKS